MVALWLNQLSNGLNHHREPEQGCSAPMLFCFDHAMRKVLTTAQHPLIYFTGWPVLSMSPISARQWHVQVCVSSHVLMRVRDD
ncbi:hypothetical protein RRG08_042874 [Elysia crispata]|uniref:Uncharacterized protein n=1 Tax=Elysia crispata TaxID=231223 RepID=A0AAE0YUB7_9GAST|nr:hypothetical protein RRG08_042874 [Elysia crispata]